MPGMKIPRGKADRVHGRMGDAIIGGAVALVVQLQPEQAGQRSAAIPDKGPAMKRRLQRIVAHQEHRITAAAQPVGIGNPAKRGEHAVHHHPTDGQRSYPRGHHAQRHLHRAGANIAAQARRGLIDPSLHGRGFPAIRTPQRQ